MDKSNKNIIYSTKIKKNKGPIKRMLSTLSTERRAAGVEERGGSNYHESSSRTDLNSPCQVLVRAAMRATAGVETAGVETARAVVGTVPATRAAAAVAAVGLRVHSEETRAAAARARAAAARAVAVAVGVAARAVARRRAVG